VRVVESAELSSEDRDRLVAGEPHPFGGEGDHLSWRAKTHSVCVRDDSDRPIAAGGIVVASVRAGGSEPFAVAGIGGVLVTRSERGRGLARVIVERLLAIAGELGPDWAMLLAAPRNVALYEKFDFRLIEGLVTADQPTGPAEMPMHGMYRALHEPAAGWPPGPVHIEGEPF
jgi:GNAT superfamily N-acetyltransferase